MYNVFKHPNEAAHQRMAHVRTSTLAPYSQETR